MPPKPKSEFNNSSDRAEACAESFNEGEQFDALHDWFGIDERSRSDVVREAVANAIRYDVDPCRLSGYEIPEDGEGLTTTNVWAVKNLAALTSSAMAKLFKLGEDDVNPSDLTAEEIRRLGQDDGAAHGLFLQIQDELLEDPEFDSDNYLEPEVDDFKSSRAILNGMSLEETTKLLNYLADYLPADHCIFRDERESGDDDDDGVFFTIVGERHLDLLSDEELLKRIPRLERLMTRVLPPELVLSGGFLANKLYVKATSLAKYLSAWGNLSERGAYFGASMGAYLHAILRLPVNKPPLLRSGTEDDRREYMARAKATADYMLDDTIMAQYFQYLREPKAWTENTSSDGRLLSSDRENANVVAEGPEAIELKLRQFIEVVKTVHASLLDQGEIEKADLLKNRSVDGIKFSNLLATK